MEILRKRGCWPPPRSLPRPITRGQLGPAACRCVQGTVRARNVVAGEVLSLLQQWYTSSMNVVCTWLTDRMDLQLHIYQLKTLIRIVKVIARRVFRERLAAGRGECMCAACPPRQINSALH